MWRVALFLIALPVTAQAEICDKFEGALGGVALLYSLPGALLTAVAYLLRSAIGTVLCWLWGLLVALLVLDTFHFDIFQLDTDLWQREPWCRQAVWQWEALLHAIAWAGVVVPPLLMIRLLRLRRREARA